MLIAFSIYLIGSLFMTLSLCAVAGKPTPRS